MNRRPTATVLGLTAVFFVLAGRAAQGAEPASEMGFRRAMVPADRKDEWPTTRETYRPVEPAEFERLVAGAERAAAGLAPRPAIVSEATYEITEVGPRHFSGTARFTVAATSGECWLLLDPFRVAIGAAQWRSDPPRSAQMAMDSQGRLVVFVDRPGTLEIRFWLAHAPSAGDALTARCEFPPAPINHLWLTVPAEFEPAISQGVLSAPAGDEGRWLCELGGHTSFELRLARAGASGQAAPRPSVRRDLAYQLSAQGIELTATLTVETNDDDVRELVVEADRHLQLVAARANSAPTTMTPLASAEADGQRVAVGLGARAGSRCVVQIFAVASLDLDTRFELPQIRVTDGDESSASLVLVAPAPLVIEHIFPKRCRQSKLTLAAGAEPGETLEFESLPAGSSLELVVGRPPQRLLGQAAFDVQLGEELTGHAAAILTASEGERPRISARLAPGWRVETLSTSPADALADWSVETDEAGRGLLVVRLVTPLTAQRSVRVTVAGRRQARLGEDSWSVAELAWLKFDNTELVGHWLRATAAPPHELADVDLDDDSLVSLEELNPDARALFEPGRPEPVLAISPATREQRFGLARQDARFAVDHRLELWADSGRWLESLALQCRPDSALRSFTVRSAPPRAEAWQWGASDALPGGLQARRLPPEKDDQGRDVPWETWEITLSRPQTVPFELRASRVVTQSTPLVAALVEVPEAAEQTGRIALGATAGTRLQIEQARLTAIPGEVPAAGRWFTTQATYEYRPQVDVAIEAPPLVASQAATATGNALQAWSGCLTTRLTPGGVSQHMFVCRLENALGARQLTMHLPEHVTLRSVLVDDRPTPRVREGARVAIDLPADVRFPTVVVHYTSRDAPPRLVDRYLPPWPTIDAALVTREAELWIPDDYDVVAAGPSQDQSGPTVQGRLFGPLAVGAPAARAPTPAEKLADTAPWRSPQISETAALNRHWSAARVATTDGRPIEFAIAHRPTLSAIGWSLLLVCLAAGALLRRRPRWHVVVTGMICCLSLLAPAALVPATSLASLGILLSWLVHALPVPNREASSRVDRAWSTRRSSVVAVASAVLAGALVLVVRAGIAQQLPIGSADDVAVVLIPVDGDGRPTGDPYQVPERLYLALERSAQRASGIVDPWLIESATYEAGTGANAEAAAAVPQWRFLADLNVLRGGVTVRVPLPRNIVAEDLRDARIGDRSLPLDWDPASGVASFEVAEAGRHRIEISLAATLATQGAAGGELIVPRLALARLRMTGNGNRPIEISSSLGPVTADGFGGLLANLGPVEMLRWEARGSGEVDPQSLSDVEVQELIWLKPQANTTLANVRCKYRVLKGSVRMLAWSADPALRLVPFSGLNSPAIRSRNGRGEFVIELPRAVTDQVTVDLTFILADAGQTGVLTWPRLEPVGARVAQRRVAVSLGANLQAAGPVAAGFVEAPVADFMAAWGAGSAVPDATYMATESGADWSLPIARRSPAVTTADDLAISVGGAEGFFRWRCAFAPPADLPFQYRARLPAALRAREVSLRTADAEHARRWSQADDGLLTIFLAEPLAAPATLTVDGEVVAATPFIPDTLRLAPITLDEVRGARRRIFVYRQHDVALRLATADGMAETDDAPAWEVPVNWGRLALALVGDVESAAELEVQPNVPRARMSLATSLHCVEGIWQAEVTALLQIEEGIVDRLRFAAPAEWTGPFRVEPPGTVRVVSSAESEPSFIEFRPATGLTGAVRIVLGGTLQPVTGKSLRAPNIQPVNVAATQRFLTLPAHADAESIAWDIQGLAAAALPPELDRDDPAAGETSTYRVVAEQFRALLRLSPVRAGVPRVAFAENRLLAFAGDSALCAAHFDIEPAGLPGCLVELPRHCQVLAVRVAEMPAAAEPQPDGRLRVALASPHLPQRLEVVFRASHLARSPDGTYRLATPRVVELPASQVLWTVPARLRPGLTPAAASADPLRIDVQRLQAASRILDQGIALCADLPPADARRWYGPWIARWAEVRARVAARLQAAAATDLTREVASELQLIDDEQARLAAQIQAEDVFEQALAVPDAHADLDRLAAAGVAIERTLFIATRPGQHELAFCPVDGSSRAAARALVAVGILLVLAWCLFGKGGALVASFFRRWPAAVGVAAGCLWWAFLWPAWLGLLLVALALWRAWRPVPWERIPAGSTIVRRASLSA